MKRSRRIYLQRITGTCLPHKCLIALICSEIQMIYLTLPFSGLVPDLWIGWAYWKTCKVNTCFQLFGLMSRKGDVDCPAFGFYVFFLIKALVSFKRAYASCCISVKRVSSVQTNWGSRSLHAIGFLCSLFFHLKINTSYSFHSSIFSYQFLWYRC